MEFNKLIDQMQQNAASIRSLATGVSDEQARWKPDPQSWSILEVICHLLDEEREDFRVRLDFILHRPGETAPAIDPQGWVSERRYNERELAAELEKLQAARADSLAWLRALGAPDWEASVAMPFGTIKAGDMFSAWVAHDLLHARQLVELHYAYTAQRVQPYSPRYAGDW